MITLRGKTYLLYRRVPSRYAAIEPRKHIWISLHTDSETVANRKAPTAWAHLEQAWEARLAGASDDAEQRFGAARELAANRGFTYLPAAQVAALPVSEIVARAKTAGRDPVEAAALLGGAAEPKITVKRSLEIYWGLTKDKTLGKSEDQIRRWKNPRLKAAANFVKVVGDKPLAEITGDDMLDFRQWWVERLESEGLTPNSANKDLTHLAVVWKTVNKMKRLGLVLPLTDLAFGEGKQRVRPPFSEEWIKTRLLARGALDALDTEARTIVLGMINTGYRPSEGAGLLREHIRLEGAVPHISIEPVGRQLKNAQSERVIPLVGVSLEAFKASPGGFPSYAGKDRVSGVVNAFLDAQKLRETPGHSLYSLRHSFEDRMLTAGIDERVRRDLMGHKLKDRERYGEGGALAFRHKLLSAIAI